MKQNRHANSSQQAQIVITLIFSEISDTSMHKKKTASLAMLSFYMEVILEPTCVCQVALCPRMNTEAHVLKRQILCLVPDS